MKNVLYVGNNLKSKKSNISGIQALGVLLENEGYTMYYASSRTNKLFRLLDMIKSCVTLSQKTDLVLIDTYSTQNFYYALVISQLCRVLKLPYITILHGGDLENRLKYNPRLSHSVFSKAHKIVAPSNFLKSVFETYGYKDLSYIPNSIEIEKYEFKNRSIDTIKILWVRSFSSLYNPKQAVLVLEQLLKMNYEATLTMIGPDADGSLAEVKNLAIAKGLEVHFTGKLTKLEWIALSKDCNVFINTTNIDNTPVSVIEAMALGLPVVSTNVGGIPFLISDQTDGLLVEPKDVSAMANAIIKLKSDEDLRIEIVTNARNKVEKFGWNAVKPQWKTLLS